MKLADFSTPEFRDNPYPLYEELRAKGRLVRLGNKAVISGHYEIVDTLLHDRRFGKRYLDSIVVRYGAGAPQMKLFQAFSRMFLLMNPPVHTRLRTLTMKAFNARQVEVMRDVARRVAHQLVDAFESKGTADLTSQFAFPLPVCIIGQMLDIPLDDAIRLGAEASYLATILDAAPR